MHVYFHFFFLEMLRFVQEPDGALHICRPFSTDKRCAMDSWPSNVGCQLSALVCTCTCHGRSKFVNHCCVFCTLKLRIRLSMDGLVGPMSLPTWNKLKLQRTKPRRAGRKARRMRQRPSRMSGRMVRTTQAVAHSPITNGQV